MTEKAEIWNKQYSGEIWDYLFNRSESYRNALITHIIDCTLDISSISSGLKVVDLGCGEGVLHDHLLRTFGKKLKYTGVDISEIALNKLVQRTLDLNNEINLKCCSLETCQANEVGNEVDVLVFNEILSYFDNPAEIVDKFSAVLCSTGLIIVSMFQGRQKNENPHPRFWKSENVFRYLENKHDLLDDILIYDNIKRPIWRLCSYRGRQAS